MRKMVNGAIRIDVGIAWLGAIKKLFVKHGRRDEIAVILGGAVVQSATHGPSQPSRAAKHLVFSLEDVARWLAKTTQAETYVVEGKGFAMAVRLREPLSTGTPQLALAPAPPPAAPLPPPPPPPPLTSPIIDTQPASLPSTHPKISFKIMSRPPPLHVSTPPALGPAALDETVAAADTLATASLTPSPAETPLLMRKEPSALEAWDMGYAEGFKIAAAQADAQALEKVASARHELEQEKDAAIEAVRARYERMMTALVTEQALITEQAAEDAEDEDADDEEDVPLSSRAAAKSPRPVKQEESVVEQTPSARVSSFRSGDRVVVLYNQKRDGRGDWSHGTIQEVRTQLEGRSVRTEYRVRADEDDTIVWVGDGGGKAGLADMVLLYPWQHAAMRELSNAARPAAATSISQPGAPSEGMPRDSHARERQAAKLQTFEPSYSRVIFRLRGLDAGDKGADAAAKEGAVCAVDAAKQLPSPQRLRAIASRAALAVLARSSDARDEHDDTTMSTALMHRCLAFRQYLEVRRSTHGKRATTKPWKLRIRRVSVGGASSIDYTDVTNAFRSLYTYPSHHRAKLYANTLVTFVDPFGRVEEGEDLGGLTTEMFSLFWLAVLAPEAGLFEQASADCDGAYLPRADADQAQLEAVGLALVKCIIDDHPIGHGFSPFVLDYLVHERQAAALLEPAAALAALRAFDSALASGYTALLDDPASVDGLKLTLEDFDEASDEGDTPVTTTNLTEAVRLGCARRLLSGRHDAFVALRRGFVRCEDLSVQCAALGSAAALSALLQGKRELTTSEVCPLTPGRWRTRDTRIARV